MVAASSVFFFATQALGSEPEPQLPVDVALPDSPHPMVQWTLTIDIGGGLATKETAPRDVEGIFHLGGHTLMFFGRKEVQDWGFGLCFDTSSWDMRAVAVGSGPALLVPFAGIWPLIVESWPYYLWEQGHGWGVTVRAWWGLHSLNFVGHHVSTAGFYVQASRSFDPTDSRRWVIVAGIDLSMIFPLLPFVAIGSASKK
jgi:hypothetical protein